MADAASTEARNFWCAARNLRRLRAQDAPDADLVEENVSEIEAIILHTDQPWLRTRCVALLDEVRFVDPLAQAVP